MTSNPKPSKERVRKYRNKCREQGLVRVGDKWLTQKKADELKKFLEKL